MLVRKLFSLLSLGRGFLVNAAVPVTGAGVSSTGGSVPLRPNINDLYAAGGAQWDLYIRALTVMFDLNSDETLSFFQIAGIHGKPYIDWNGAGPRASSAGWGGYCPHGEEIFVVWHRPFVMLYEQVLVSYAQQIAQQYPENYRAQYTQAADTLRVPYWDWGADSTVPPVTALQTVTINVPKNDGLESIAMPNPLYTYKFPSAALSGQYGPFDSQNRSEILRCPSPQTYPDSANALMAQRPYKTWVYDTFTRSQTFGEFATTGNGGSSLEQIHNAVHWDAACGNQFIQADFSAFDPLFMLHHCNVDRLWAYWQAINPDQAIFNNSYVGGSRFATPAGSTITLDSPLEPFFASTSAFHTARTVDNLDGLGYSYSGLEYWEKSTDQMSQDAIQLINQLYGSSTAPASRRVRRAESVTRYFANIQIDVAEVEKPCSINLYVDGKIGGSFIVMQQPASGVLYGGFSLDAAAPSSASSGTTADAVVSSIKSGLQCEIVKYDGTSIPISSVPSLKIDLEDVLMTPPTNDHELPTYASPNVQPARAVQRVGGPGSI